MLQKLGKLSTILGIDICQINGIFINMVFVPQKYISIGTGILVLRSINSIQHIMKVNQILNRISYKRMDKPQQAVQFHLGIFTKPVYILQVADHRSDQEQSIVPH